MHFFWDNSASIGSMVAIPLNILLGNRLLIPYSIMSTYIFECNSWNNCSHNGLIAWVVIQGIIARATRLMDHAVAPKSNGFII